MGDRPLFIKWSGEIDKQDHASFRQEVVEMNNEHVPLRVIEEEIADWWFRRYIPIPILSLAVRPFWRDDKVAPPLPVDTRIYKPSHHY